MNPLYSIAFMTGLVGSFHCVGMCGPIAVALPIGKLNFAQATIRRVGYNLGRILTYGLLGAVFGYFGKTLFVAGLQQQLSVFIGVFMLLFVYPNKVVSWGGFQKIIYFVKNTFKKVLFMRSLIGFVFLGLLNGLLPCGFVYVALAGAIGSLSIIEGAVFMIFFGLGTSPMMFSVGVLPKFLSYSTRQKINKYLPIYTFLLAIFFIFRGLNLGIPYLSPQLIDAQVSQAVPICH